MLYTGLYSLKAKVQSLEDKYVRFLYKKVQALEKEKALEKCSPFDRQQGKY